MDDFESRKKEYIDKLKDNTDLIDALYESDDKSNRVLENFLILLDPKNEKELEIANALFNIFLDSRNLVEDVRFGDVKEIDPEDSFINKIYIKMINDLKENGNIDITREELKRMESNPEISAVVSYDLLSSFIKDPETNIEYIAKNTGFDNDDYISNKIMMVYLEIANKEMKNFNNPTQSVYLKTDEGIDYVIRFSKKFHELVEAGKIDSKEDLKSKRLIK